MLAWQHLCLTTGAGAAQEVRGAHTHTQTMARLSRLLPPCFTTQLSAPAHTPSHTHKCTQHPADLQGALQQLPQAAQTLTQCSLTERHTCSRAVKSLEQSSE
jgi:hypothetical protein